MVESNPFMLVTVVTALVTTKGNHASAVTEQEIIEETPGHKSAHLDVKSGRVNLRW